MSASRHRPKSGGRRSLGLVIFLLAMMPTPVGFQDLAALIVRQPAVSDRWRQYVRVTPFGTVQAATFSFPQPLGTMIPVTPGYTLASLDPRALDITGSIGNPRLNPLAEQTPPIAFPAVDRTLKGDLLVPRERLVPGRAGAARTNRKRRRRKRRIARNSSSRSRPSSRKPKPKPPQVPAPAKPQVVESKPEAPET